MITCYPMSASIYFFFAKPFRDPEMKRQHTLLRQEEMQPPAAEMNGTVFLQGKLEFQMSPGPTEGESENSQSAGSQDALQGLLRVRLCSGWLHSSLSKGQLILSFFFLRPSSFLLLLQRVYIYTKPVIRNPLIHTTQTTIFHVL